jgi:hypothetical protein
VLECRCTRKAKSIYVKQCYSDYQVLICLDAPTEWIHGLLRTQNQYKRIKLVKEMTCMTLSWIGLYTTFVELTSLQQDDAHRNVRR